MTCLFLYLLWIAYISYEGIREAGYWHYLIAANGKPSNEHKTWTVQRIFVFLTFFIACGYELNDIWLTLAFCGCLVLASPFWHDGNYYCSRHKLDPKIYDKGFFSQSTTSTAKMTRFGTPFLRTLYFLLSFVILFIFVIRIFNSTT